MHVMKKGEYQNKGEDYVIVFYAVEKISKIFDEVIIGIRDNPDNNRNFKVRRK